MYDVATLSTKEKHQAAAFVQNAKRLDREIGWHYTGEWWRALLPAESAPPPVTSARLLVMPGAKALPGSPTEWLFAYERTIWGKRRRVAIASVTADRSPRRIIFVAENGPEMTKAARAIESAVVAEILSKARPEDSFGLLTAGGPRAALGFGSSRAELLAAAKTLANPPSVTGTSRGVRDALLEATTWFRKPKPGDAIFVMTMGLEGKNPGFLGTLRHVTTLGVAQRSQASYAQDRAAVLRRHIRVFGFQLGSSSYNGPACPASMCGVPILPNEFGEAAGFGSLGGDREELLGLSWATFGGYVLADTDDADYSLTPSGLARLESYADAMYAAISEYYVLHLSSRSKNLVIGFKPKVQNQFPFSFVFYSPNPPACSSK